MKFAALTVTVVVPVDPRFTVSAVALNVVCTEPIVSAMFAVCPGNAVGIVLEVPITEIA